MSDLTRLLLYVRGPRLYQIDEATAYSRNWLELLPDLYINCVSTLTGLAKWTFPIWMSAAYRRGYFSREKMVNFIMLISGVTASVIIAQVFRGLGRVANPSYRRFLDVLVKAQNSSEMKEQLVKYDFDFHAWPVDFDARTEKIDVGRLKVPTPSHPDVDCGLSSFAFVPLDLAGWLLVHTVGIRMTYPGVVLSSLLRQQLTMNRQRMILEHGVQRIKLRTDEGLEIEALYADRRGTEAPHRDIIVICCEGNAGFPEVGCPQVPLALGYSVIGWNHPGFAGSTGMPYPEQEQDAMDAVVQFVKSRLGFAEEQIVVHGWSIGGYTASWAAMNYPRVGALILDATFDNNEELSVNAMPAALSPFVRRTVRRNLFLNVGDQLKQYDGPILLIRRTQDEIIATENRHVSSNRGNFLLINLLEHRYPKLMTPAAVAALTNYLGVESHLDRERIMSETGVDGAACTRALARQLGPTGDVRFPSPLGDKMDDDDRKRMVLFLANKYLKNFEAMHCTPLRQELFVRPWSERQAAKGTNSNKGPSNSGTSSGSEWERVDSGEPQQ